VAETFLERARILIERQVPIAPVLPNDKRCVLQRWPDRATLDWNQIEEWAVASPNGNTAAVCASNGIVVLDADSAELAEIVKPLLQEPTFVVLSAGKQLPHFYFRQTEESRQLGNCIVIKDGRHLADLQSNRKYVVGPMSRLATGNEYKIASDAPIQPVPPALIEWLRTNCVVEKPVVTSVTVNAGSELSEDFDFEDFCKHFNITGYWKGRWFLTDWCPVSGFPHNGSKHTGIYFDGNRLGFHCFAAGCEGTRMSFGQVLRHLNAVQEPYRGAIWKDDAEKWLKNWRGSTNAAKV
jgi:hypothetical protein